MIDNISLAFAVASAQCFHECYPVLTRNVFKWELSNVFEKSTIYCIHINPLKPEFLIFSENILSESIFANYPLEK